ncbi:uncharacterized protein LOC118406362 isoform X2 [Branchiostoma floridae]|uniref:Uncharacterized protein LOC118406362 isoform X2 n=1 Tax=Branchiostoma floridae TaxID=7739 RepID=A0A9J7KGQ5_BRAFL|nr:uncharacterized protein LOC118406362 isoform X2 [Branchiostoma floridae]
MNRYRSISRYVVLWMLCWGVRTKAQGSQVTPDNLIGPPRSDGAALQSSDHSLSGKDNPQVRTTSETVDADDVTTEKSSSVTDEKFARIETLLNHVLSRVSRTERENSNLRALVSSSVRENRELKLTVEKSQRQLRDMVSASMRKSRDIQRSNSELQRTNKRLITYLHTRWKPEEEDPGGGYRGNQTIGEDSFEVGQIPHKSLHPDHTVLQRREKRSAGGDDEDVDVKVDDIISAQQMHTSRVKRQASWIITVANHTTWLQQVEALVRGNVIKVEAMQGDVSQLRQMNTEMQASLITYVSTVSDMGGDVENNRNRIHRLQDGMTKMGVAIRNLERRLYTGSQSAGQVVQGGDTSEVTARLTELEKSVKVLQIKSSQFSSVQISELQRKVSELGDAVTRMENQMEAVPSKIISNSQYVEMYRRISGLEQTVNTLRASVGGGREPSGVREVISQLRNRLVNLERQVQAFAGRGGGGGGNFAPSSALDQALTRLERVEQSLTVLQGQVGSAGGGGDVAGLRQLRERVTDVENNINRIRSQVVSTGSQSISTSEITDLQLKVSALDETFRSYQPLLLKLADVDTRLRDLESSGTQGSSGPDVGTAIVSRIRTRIGRLEQGMFGRILSGYSQDPVSNKMKQEIDKNRGLIESYTTLVPEVQQLQRHMDRVQSNSNRHATSIAELQDRTETMSQRLNELDGFYRQNRLRSRLSSIQTGAVNTTALRKLRLEVSALQGSVFRLLESANRMDDLEEKMDTMELTVLGAATQVTKTEVDQIRTTVGKLQEETLQWGDDWSEVQTKLADLELRLRTMKGTVDILETKSIRPPDPVPDQKLTEESARQLSTVTESLSTVQLKVNSMENLITEYVSKVTGLDIKSSRIHEVMASQSNLIGDLDDKTRDMWDTVETAKQDVIRVKRDMLTLQQKMKFQTSLVSKLNASLGNQNSAMSQLFNNMDVQNNQISDFEKALGDAKASQSQIESSVRNSATLLSRLAEKVDTLQATQPVRGSISSGASLIPVSAQREVRDQLNPIKRTISNHSRQLFEMRQSVDDVRRLLRSHSDEMTRLSNTEGEMSGRLAKQMTMILNLESSSEAYTKSVSKQRDAVDQLKGQVKSHDKTLGKLRQSSASQDVGIQNLQKIVNGHTIQMLNTSSLLGNHSQQIGALKGASYKLELDFKNHSKVLTLMALRDDNIEDSIADQALNLGRMRNNLQTLQRETYTHFAEYEQLASSIDNLDGSYVTRSELRKKLYEIDNNSKNHNSSIMLLQRENREQFSVLDKHSLFIRDVRNLLEEKADVSNIMDIIQREARGDLMRLHNVSEAHSAEIRALQDARDQHSDGIYKTQTSLTTVGDDIRMLREDLGAIEITMTSHTDSLGRLATLASTATDGRQSLNLTVLELDRKTRKHSDTLQTLGRIVSVLESISDNHEATIRDQDTGLTSLKVEATRTQRALQNLTKTDILLEKRVARLRTTQIEHNAAISRLSLQTSTVETSLSEQYNTIADLKMEDVEIKDSVVQVAVAMGKMNDTVIEHSRDIRELLKSSSSEQSRVSNFERVLSTQIEAISSLGSSVQNYTTLNAFLSSRLKIENRLYELGNGLLYVNNTLYNYARRIQTMEGETSTSRRRISQHNADLRELKTFEKRAEKDIEDQLSMIYRIEEDLESVDYVVNNHVNMIEELESTAGNHTSLLLGLDNKARYISADIISLDRSLKKQNDVISRLTNTTTLHADSLAQAQEAARRLRLFIRNNTEAIGGVGRRVQQVAQLVKSNTLKISSLEQKDSQFESDISGLDLMLSQEQRRSDEVEERVRELTVDDSFLRTRQNRFSGEMFNLNTTLFRLRKDHKSLEDIVSRLRTVSTVRHVVMEEQFRNITDRTAVNYQLIGGLNFSITEIDTTLENHSNWFNLLKSQLSAHDRRMRTNDRRIIIQGSSIEKLQSRATDLGESFTSAGQAITDLRTDVEGTFNDLNIRTQAEFKRRDSAIANLTQDIRNHTAEIRNSQEVDRQLRQEDGRLRDLLGEYLTVINRHETGLSEQSNGITYLRTLIRTQQALTGNHTQALTRLKLRDRVLENAIDEIKLVFLPNDAIGIGNNLLSSASDLRNPFTQITRLEDKLDTISTSVTQQSRDITQLEEAGAQVKDDLYEHVAQYQKSDRRLSTAVSRLQEHVANVRNATREQDTKLYQLESLGEMLESVLNDNINTVSDIQDRISNIGDDIREQNVTLQDFQYKMGLLDKKDIDLNRLINVLQVRNRKQESTLVEHTASLSGLARRARNHENSIRSGEELNQYFKQKADQHTEQIDAMKVEVGTLASKVDRTEKTLLGKSAELAVLLKDNVEATLETYASEITDWVARQGTLELQVALQNDSILSLETRTDRLQANSKDHSKDLQQLVPLADELRKDMNRARIDLVELERNGKKMTSRVERHTEEISNLQDKSDQQGGMLNDQATNINTLTLEQRNFRVAMNNRTTDILELRRQLQLLEAGDENLRGGLQQVAFNLNQGMQAAQRATQRLEASMYNQTNTVYQIRTMTNSIRNELARKARQETRGERQLDLKMGLFQRTLTENTESIRTQRVKNDDQDSKILRQSDALEKLQNANSQFQSRVGNQSVWLQKIQSKADQLTSTFADLRKQFNGVDLKAERVQQGLNNQTVALQQFEFRLSDIESSAVDDGGMANQLNAKILALKSSIAQDLQEIQSQVEEIQSNAGDLRTLAGMHQRLKSEVRQVNQLFTQQRGTIGRMIQKNQQLERQIETQDESMTEMDTILYRLEQDMEQLKRDARRRPVPPQAEQSRSIDTEVDSELDSSQDQPPSSTLSLEQVVDLLRRGRRSTGDDPDSASVTASWQKMNDSIADLLENHQQDLTEVVDAMKLFRTQAESLIDKDEKLERLYESLAKKVATLVAVQKKSQGTMGNRALSRQMFKIEASMHETYDVIGRIDQQVLDIDNAIRLHHGQLAQYKHRVGRLETVLYNCTDVFAQCFPNPDDMPKHQLPLKMPVMDDQGVGRAGNVGSTDQPAEETPGQRTHRNNTIQTLYDPDQNGGCLPGEFPCASGGCIDLWWRCDHDNDCLDGSDEIDCVYPECHADQFRCAGSGRCISARWRCDGERDCRDASDETGCNEYLSAENLTRIDPDSFSLGNKVSAEDVEADTSPAQTAVFDSHSAKDIRPMKAKSVVAAEENDPEGDVGFHDNSEDTTEHARVDHEDQQVPFVELKVGG